MKIVLLSNRPETCTLNITFLFNKYMYLVIRYFLLVLGAVQVFRDAVFEDF